MINQTLFSFLAVFTIFTANFHSFVLNEPTNALAKEELKLNAHSAIDIDTLIKEIFIFMEPSQTEKSKTVTTSETSREPLPTEEDEEPEGIIERVSAEPEFTPEELHLQALTEWQANFPTYESDSHQTQFIETIAPTAVLIANTQGIYPSVMIAQAALESSWGQSGLAQNYNNLMGTKGSWKGESVTVSTREDVNGQSIYINAGFSVYDSWTESLNRYGQLMKHGVEHDSEIYHGTWRENAKTYQDATAWLQGRYATDTAYATKLNQTIESFNLDQYDGIESPAFDLEETLPQLAENL